MSRQASRLIHFPLTALILSAASLSAQQPNLESIRAGKKVKAFFIDEPITVDGWLNEPAWERAEPAKDFYQQEPDEGQLATRETEVRFLYNATTLYVGAMLFDEQPEKLITNELKRDFGGRNGDLLGIVLDTFRDRQNSYGFLTNPGGAQRETQGYDNGRRNDANWDGVWFVRTAIHENGWSAEMAIPFKTLRFPDKEIQEWGLNIVRVIRRVNEVVTWSPTPRQFSHYNVAYAGLLSGIQTHQRARNLRIKPFTTAQVGTRRLETRNWDADGGIDLKWGLTPSLVLDATYRTDFSQVEADEQQINLTRFSLFFPEKREFFLESPASFQIGLLEAGGENRRDLVPFFSRRIGLSSTGQPIPVVGGLRLTGRAGPYGIGLLNMQTESTADRPGDNFTALRMTKDLSRTASLGGFYFGRESEGATAHNRVGGFDIRLTPRRTLQIEAFAMHSVTDGEGSDWAGRAGLRLDTNAHRARLFFLHIGDGFRHDLGFVPRRDIGLFFGRYTRIFRPRSTSGWVREHSLGASIEVVEDSDYGPMLTRIGTLTYDLGLSDGGGITVDLRNTEERLSSPFRIRSDIRIPVGQYSFADLAVRYQSNRSSRVSGSAEYGDGHFWSGKRRTLQGSVRVRLNAHLAASAGFERNRVDLREGSFLTHLGNARLDWSFTPRMFLNAFVQYNSDTDAWLSNVRFNLIHRPLSDIYVVWNETRAPGLKTRSVIFKYTHLISF